jgi:hypothetical protein
VTVAHVSDTQQTQASSQFSMQFIQKAGVNVKNSFKMLLDPQNVLKIMGIVLPNDYFLASSIVQSKLAKIPEVRDFSCLQHNKMLHLMAYINEPNEDAEKKIYQIYGEMLDLFPDTNVDLQIIELYGRPKEQVPLTNL